MVPASMHPFSVSAMSRVSLLCGTNSFCRSKNYLFVIRRHAIDRAVTAVCGSDRHGGRGAAGVYSSVSVGNAEAAFTSCDSVPTTSTLWRAGAFNWGQGVHWRGGGFTSRYIMALLGQYMRVIMVFSIAPLVCRFMDQVAVLTHHFYALFQCVYRALRAGLRPLVDLRPVLFLILPVLVGGSPRDTRVYLHRSESIAP